MNKSSGQDHLQHAVELGNIVHESNIWAEQLLAVLEDERVALSSGDVTRIDSCGQTKTECVAQLECLDRERQDLCQLMSVADSDIESFLSQHDTNSGAQGWSQFLDNLQLCREANAINGQITQLRRRHVERALQVLRGGADTNPGLYGPDGMDNSSDVNVLGQA